MENNFNKIKILKEEINILLDKLELFNKKTCLGAIRKSLNNNRKVIKGKLKNYKFSYVDL